MATADQFAARRLQRAARVGGGLAMSEHVFEPLAANLCLHDGWRLGPRALFRVERGGDAEPVALGPRAIALLRLLAGRPGALVSKGEIIAAVWGGAAISDNNLTVQIAALRRVLDRGRGGGSCIETVPGRGYRYLPPDNEGRGSNAAVLIQSGASPPSAAEHRRLPRASHWLVGGLAALAVAGAVLAIGWQRRSHTLAEAPLLSIVVLPFANLGGDPSQQYFADGMTEDVTTDLSRLADMVVISRDTARAYGGKPVDIRRIGRKLRVRYVLDGSVRRKSQKFRVTAQLIDARRDTLVWAGRFDHDTGDPFAVEDEITRQMAIALDTRLLAAAARRPTGEAGALDWLLRARAARLGPPSRESFAEAERDLNLALAADPASAEAKAVLAGLLVARRFAGMTATPETDLARAESLADEALAASPRNAAAHMASAQILRAQHRCTLAILEYERVLAIDRNQVHALSDIGRCRMLVGPVDQAIPAELLAIRLSPADPDLAVWYARVGEAHLVLSHTAEAIPWLEKAEAVDPALTSIHLALAAAYGLRNDRRRAAGELAEARGRDGNRGFRTITEFKNRWNLGETAEIRALYEATLLVGLRRAGMPEA